MKILITGDSHTGALKRGLDLLIGSGEIDENTAENITVKPMGSGNHFKNEFCRYDSEAAFFTHPRFAARFEKMPVEDDDVWYAISAPFHSGRVYRNADWKRLDIAALTNTANSVVSTSLIKAVIKDDLKYIIEFLNFLQTKTNRVCVVESPYPFRGMNRIDDEKAHQIDTLYREIALSLLDESGIPVVKVPEKCTENGFTKSEFHIGEPDDPHHAKAEYGAILISEILNTLEQVKNQGEIDPPYLQHYCGS